jgi:hypothetical protein
MADVFRELVPAFFVAAYRTSRCSADAFSQLCSLLDLWKNREVYDATLVENVKAQMLAVVLVFDLHLKLCSKLFCAHQVSEQSSYKRLPCRFTLCPRSIDGCIPTTDVVTTLAHGVPHLLGGTWAERYHW